MRKYGIALVVLGLIGLGFGILTLVRSKVPFSYETGGGPGTVFGGLILLACGGWLLSLRDRNA